jgi:RNA polymerase sigma-70 factor (ECF subfamily)
MKREVWRNTGPRLHGLTYQRRPMGWRAKAPMGLVARQGYSINCILPKRFHEWKSARMTRNLNKDETPPAQAGEIPLPAPRAAVVPAGPELLSLAEMTPELYDELRRLAASYLRGERTEHTLQRTALVHEAYLRLNGEGMPQWQNQAHFLGVFARIMRQTLTNYAVARTREKRGGVDRFNKALEFYEERQIDVSALDGALRELETVDPRQGQIVELRFFAGLTITEIATAMNISSATVKREWALAKIWLRREISRSS